MIYKKTSVSIFISSLVYYVFTQQPFRTETFCDAVNATEDKGACFCVCAMERSLMCELIQVHLSTSSDFNCLWIVNNNSLSSPYLHSKTNTSLSLKADEISESDQDIVIACLDYSHNFDVIVDVVLKGEKVETWYYSIVDIFLQLANIFI